MRQGIIEEKACGNCFFYILERADSLQTTEYKVMQSQDNSVFVPCMRMAFNGQPALFYLPGNDLKPLDSIWQMLDEKTIVQIVEKLIEAVIKVRDNGFLDCGRLEIAWNRLYVNKHTKEISLVYLPISQKNYESYDSFEHAFRMQLIEAVANNPGVSLAELRIKIEDPMMSLDEIAKCKVNISGEKGAASKHCVLNAMNTQKKVTIAVTKNAFVIGRHPQMADAAIGVSPAIGKRHCRIDCENGEFYITDLESKNYTYVNKQRLTPNEPALLRNGDMVRMADVVFQVEIK